MKQCKQCGECKPITEFYKHPANSDGLLGQCKACVRERVRLHRRMNESVRAYDRLRAKTEKRKALSAQNRVKWRAENEAAYKAQTAVGNALRDGKLHKEPCAICATAQNVHAHHKDYSDPLNVTWLCAKCHARIHAQGLAYANHG